MLVLRPIAGFLKEPDGDPLLNAKIVVRSINGNGEGGIFIPNYKITIVADDETGEYESELYTSDVADTFVRYEANIIVVENGRDRILQRKKFDLIDGAETSLDALFTLYDGQAAVSDAAVLADILARLVALEASGGGSETTTTLGALINGATAKATPVDADMLALMDSAAANVVKKLSWANVKVAIDARVQLIVDTAPAALDTLNELAAALGDDADFAGTVTTALAGKQTASTGLGQIGALADPNADRILFWDDSAGAWVHLSLAPNLVISGTELRVIEKIGIACSDLSTNIAVGTTKGFYHNRGGQFTVTDVYAEMLDAPTGSTAIFDINEGGTTILSTKLSIDAGENDSINAATPAVISDSVIANNAKITVDFDQVGSTNPGKGVVVWLAGYRS